jgi:hypothetical protein
MRITPDGMKFAGGRCCDGHSVGAALRSGRLRSVYKKIEVVLGYRMDHDGTRHSSLPRHAQPSALSYIF